jgi:deazaflavin-dependent oxidoreductase (nitroreductase family)
VRTTFPRIDPTARPSRYRRTLHRIASTGAGRWCYMHVSSRIDPWLIRVTGGRFDTGLGAAPVALLTARGARSGIERTVPVLFFHDGDDVVLVASSFGRPRHPAWYFNLRRHPEATLTYRGRSARFVARETHGEDRARLLGLAEQLYRGYGNYQERTAGVREIPVLRLSPAG